MHGLRSVKALHGIESTRCRCSQMLQGFLVCRGGEAVKEGRRPLHALATNLSGSQAHLVDYDGHQWKQEAK